MIDNKPLRTTRLITVRPLKESGLGLFKVWLEIWVNDWDKITCEMQTDEKAKYFHETKVRKISSDDQP